MSSWVDDKERYEQMARAIDPAIRLTTKDGWFWKVIAWILFIITFGQFKRERFLEDFATTIGPIQAYPRSYSSIYEGTLVHEGRHTKQARWFGLGIHPWVGLPFMAIAYLLLPIPAGLAYLRYRLELDADRAKWKWMMESGYSADQVLDRAQRFAETVSSSAYAWAWPKPWAVKGFLREANKVVSEYETA